MSAKRVTDVTTEYDEPSTAPAKDAEISRIKRQAVALKTGQVEKTVDKVLTDKGFSLHTSLGGRKKRLR